MNAKLRQQLLKRSQDAEAQFQSGRQQYQDSETAYLTADEAENLLDIIPGDDGIIVENVRFTGTFGGKAFFVLPTSDGNRKVSTRKHVASDFDGPTLTHIHLKVLPPTGEYKNPFVTVQYAEKA